jgi:hypothetical protein
MNTDRIGRAEARRLAEDEFQRFVLGSADAQASVGSNPLPL